MQLLVPAEQQEVEEAGREEGGAAVEALAEGGERDLVEGGADPHGLEDEGDQAEAELEGCGEAGPGLHAGHCTTGQWSPAPACRGSAVTARGEVAIPATE